jgi:hypothetical protein
MSVSTLDAAYIERLLLATEAARLLWEERCDPCAPWFRH